MVEKIERWTEVLRQHRLRITPQRLLILRALEELESEHAHPHLTAKDVYAKVRQSLPGVNVTTVYRTLEGLHQAGLVDSLSSFKDQVRFALRHPGHRHGHLICKHCGRVETFPVVHLGEFSAQMLSRYGFQLEQDHLTLYGSCQQCRQSGSATGEEPDS